MSVYVNNAMQRAAGEIGKTRFHFLQSLTSHALNCFQEREFERCIMEIDAMLAAHDADIKSLVPTSLRASALLLLTDSCEGLDWNLLFSSLSSSFLLSF